MTPFPELVERLERAEVGSRELDAAICVLTQYGGPNSEGAANVRTDDDWEGDLLFEVGPEECCNSIPPVTTSLDAALALAERVLPGKFWTVYAAYKIEGCMMTYGVNLDDDSDTAYAKSPALALCAATLRALQKDKVP